MSKVVFLIMFLIIGTACSLMEPETERKEEELLSINSPLDERVIPEYDPNENYELTLWSYFSDGWDEAIEEFQKDHRNIEIEVKTFPFEEYQEVYFNALVNGNVPDIMVFDSDHFGSFTAIEGLENLKDPPYSAGKYKGDFSTHLWEVGLSFDQEKLIGIPFNTSPLVTFYRADIMEEYGFPSEPEELAVFMEDPKNWLTIGETLKKDDRWITQWINEIMHIYNSGTGLYSNQLDFLRDNEEFVEGIDVAKEAYRLGIVANFDVWSPIGNSKLQSDQLVMLYLGAWGAGQLETWVPEQKGKWRMTRLPFNIFGWSNSTILSIPRDSDNKAAAWRFIEHYTFEAMMNGTVGSVPGYLSARNNANTIHHQNEFFGGQYDQALFEELMSQTKEHKLTPLDQRAKTIWDVHLSQGVEWGVDTKEILDRINAQLEAELGRERNILLDNLQSSP
ncbi:ABC transporter substrate-binding protein [Evansella tamaricis]|nr:extracellular solute-binding protein [Evansella tamaricis]